LASSPTTTTIPNLKTKTIDNQEKRLGFRSTVCCWRGRQQRQKSRKTLGFPFHCLSLAGTPTTAENADHNQVGKQFCLKIKSELCCEQCGKITHNHFEYPICGDEYAASDAYGDLSEDPDFYLPLLASSPTTTTERNTRLKS